MSQNHRRKLPQHDTEAISRSQLSEFFQRQSWVVVQINPDYGEDLLVRVFEDGNTTGHEFYVQLKGTEDEEIHALASGDFSYSVKVSALRQWWRNPVPTVFILWDTEKREGYWLSSQPYITEVLRTKPNWFEKAAKRRIQISHSQRLSDATFMGFKAAVQTECQAKHATKLEIEREQQQENTHIDDALAGAIPSSDHIDTDAHLPDYLATRLHQQAEAIRLEAAIISNPHDPKLQISLATLYYHMDEFDKALIHINQAAALTPPGPSMLHARACILAEYAIAHGGQPKSLLNEALVHIHATCWGMTRWGS